MSSSLGFATVRQPAFHRFNDLPPEIRIMIWRLYLKYSDVLPIKYSRCRFEVYGAETPLVNWESTVLFGELYPHRMDTVCADLCHIGRDRRKYVRVNFDRDIFYIFSGFNPGGHNLWCHCFLKENPIRRLIMDENQYEHYFHEVHYDSSCNEVFITVGPRVYSEHEGVTFAAAMADWSYSIRHFEVEGRRNIAIPDTSRFVKHTHGPNGEWIELDGNSNQLDGNSNQPGGNTSNCPCYIIEEKLISPYKGTLVDWDLTMDRNVIGLRPADAFPDGPRVMFRLTRKKPKNPFTSLWDWDVYTKRRLYQF